MIEGHDVFRGCLSLLAITLACADVRGGDQASAVNFARDVRPILASNCFHCHGPDASHREADLRLDVWDNAGDLHGAQHVIDSKKLAESELIKRITSDDPDVHMPPADSGKMLRPEQVETLQKWVLQGGKYEQHWSFVAPKRPKLPTVKDQSWVRNPIDAFVLARLEHDGLQPSPEANRNTLLRRMSLDLIGLPPTLDELAAFEHSAGQQSLQHEIDRLLASPHYGERWGRIWLDAARYADSDGFEKDKPRFVWMYRDWVINALNRDEPYNQFIIEQIAGDLLPHPTQDQQVATGFLRNSMINEEGGIDPEQFRMEAMYDRMDAIGKGILGLTIQCAQCHSHKYDPLTQTEYYQLFAFLNNCHEAQITVYTREQQDEWKSTEDLIRKIEDRLRAAHPDWPERMAAWEQTVHGPLPEWTIVRTQHIDSGGQKYYEQDDGSTLAAGYAPTTHTTEFRTEIKPAKIAAFRLELMNDKDLPHGGPGRSIFGTCALTEFKVEATPLDHSDQHIDLKFSKATADVNPPERELDKAFDDRKGNRRVTGPITYANDGDVKTAWGIDIGPGRSNVPRQAVFTLDKPLDAPAGVRLTFKLFQNHGGWNSDDNQNNNIGRFRFAMTSAENAVADPIPVNVRAILNTPAAKRTAEQTAALFSYWRTTVPDWQEENRRIEALWQSHPQGATQLALVERETPRKTHRLERGNFLAPAEEVTPGVPAFLQPLETVVRASQVVRGSPDPAQSTTAGLLANASGRPAVDRGARSGDPRTSMGDPRTTSVRPTRLDFAHWLADRRSPTTARSIVNRIWQAYFGTGLVATAEDLGSQGEPPSHPELLDWLAVELMDHNWSLKHIQRLIVDSATYRQSSHVTPQLLERDPANRLLARGPRYRVDAESVRDVALEGSGLLNPTVGGPSVFPPAPKFLFQPPASYGPKTWIVDTGPDRYRRALYTFRFRSVPYPMLQTFDAPIGEIACARRSRSNTPLQALTTLNEPLFVECARALALRLVKDGGSNDADRIAYAVRRCLSRDPKADEQKVLSSFLERQKQHFQQAGIDPWPLLAGDEKAKQKVSSEMPAGTTANDLAAWTAVARVILNLDETITKE
jgi:hypothetical protein